MYEIKYFPNYGQMNLVNNILVVLFLCNKAIAFFQSIKNINFKHSLGFQDTSI